MKIKIITTVLITIFSTASYALDLGGALNAIKQKAEKSQAPQAVTPTTPSSIQAPAASTTQSTQGEDLGAIVKKDSYTYKEGGEMTISYFADNAVKVKIQTATPDVGGCDFEGNSTLKNGLISLVALDADTDPKNPTKMKVDVRLSGNKANVASENTNYCSPHGYMDGGYDLKNGAVTKASTAAVKNNANATSSVKEASKVNIPQQLIGIWAASCKDVDSSLTITSTGMQGGNDESPFLKFTKFDKVKSSYQYTCVIQDYETEKCSGSIKVIDANTIEQLDASDVSKKANKMNRCKK